MKHTDHLALREFGISCRTKVNTLTRGLAQWIYLSGIEVPTLYRPADIKNYGKVNIEIYVYPLRLF